MKASLGWLSDYVKVGEDPEALARALTLSGLEVEGLDRLGQGLAGVVVAQIVESKPHPDADRLSVTRVDAGGAQPLQVVCGAKNYRVGDKVPLATAGTRLPNGMEIKVAPLRGVESAGMLCSERELGISEESTGLMILDADLKVGTSITKALGLEDTVFEVNVTPNRSDALSHLGIAREVGALTGASVRRPEVKLREAGGKAADKVSVRIEDTQRCSRYAARVVEGVKVGPSPAWMVARLRACGVRSINNVVDVTNYVLLEYGQPLHAYDLDRVGGAQIVVRTARVGETLTTLDGKERALDPDDLLICDRDRPHVLAGVMGGADSEVSQGTTRVLLEAAHFLPSIVRRASKRHALHTESSHRFERGTDVESLPAVLDRAAALIAELAGGTVLEGRLDVYPKALEPRRVVLRPARVEAVLGVAVPEQDAQRILEALGFVLEERGAAGWRWRVPSWRVDVEHEEDLIEEVARVYGYDAIAPAHPAASAEVRRESPRVEVERRVREALAGAGMDEVLNYSFVSPRELGVLAPDHAPIALQNPLSVEQSVMRTTLAAGLLQNASRSLRHQVESVWLYEVGCVYWPDPDGGRDRRPVARELRRVAGVLAGRRASRTWTGRDEPVDFYDAKGAVEAVLSTLRVRAQFERAQASVYHPRATAAVRVGDETVGMLGELHPKVAKALDLPGGIHLFELDLDLLERLAHLVPSYASLPRFPAVRRDLAVVVPLEQEQAAVRRVILEVGAPLVVEATVFDVYTGKPVPEGRKNLAYALEYRAVDRTLTDEEVSAAHARIVEQVHQRLGAQLRA